MRAAAVCFAAIKKCPSPLWAVHPVGNVTDNVTSRAVAVALRSHKGITSDPGA